MVIKKTNQQDEKVKSSGGFESRKAYSKNFIVYYLKRVFHYIIILHGIMTITFLIIYSQGILMIDLYIFISISAFIAYGIIIFSLSFLDKPEIEMITHKPTKELLLEGKTLQIYWYVFTHGLAGIREIQKALDISSSGTVSYQITKLIDAGLLLKDEVEGKYYIKEEIKNGIFKFYIRIRNRVIPRVSLYLIIYIFGFVFYLFFVFIQGSQILKDPIGLLLLFFLIFGTIILILQTIKVRKIKPSA
ncbi:MAG: hypothetical protein ACFFBH_02125 [Promethearchaeota archaeon]